MKEWTGLKCLVCQRGYTALIADQKCCSAGCCKKIGNTPELLKVYAYLDGLIAEGCEVQRKRRGY